MQLRLRTRSSPPESTQVPTSGRITTLVALKQASSSPTMKGVLPRWSRYRGSVGVRTA